VTRSADDKRARFLEAQHSPDVPARKVYEQDGIAVFHGDFRDVPREHVDAIVTDPPYLGARGQSWTGSAAPLSVPYRPATQELLNDLIAIANAMVPCGWFVCFQDFPGCLHLRERIQKPWRLLHAPLPWMKPPGAFVPAGSGNTVPKSVDFITAARRGQAVDRQRRGYYVSPSYSPNRDIFITGGKPVRLMMEVLQDFTQPGDLIFDPCCGAGTTLLAAKLTGRRAFGCDIERSACDLTIERLRTA